MVVRIHNLGKWKSLAIGSILHLDGMADRRIRLDVNCVAPTRFDVVDDTGVLTFVGVVQGLETLEFHAQGELIQVHATSQDEVFYYTADGESVAVEYPDEESLTTPENRRERNPAVEAFMQKAEANIMRRVALGLAEIEMRRARELEAEGDGNSVGVALAGQAAAAGQSQVLDPGSPGDVPLGEGDPGAQPPVGADPGAVKA